MVQEAVLVQSPPPIPLEVMVGINTVLEPDGAVTVGILPNPSTVMFVQIASTTLAAVALDEIS